MLGKNWRHEEDDESKHTRKAVCLKDNRSIFRRIKPTSSSWVKDADDQANHAPMEQLTQGAHTSEHREDRADEEPFDEELAAPEPGFASGNPRGYATDQSPQSIEK